MIEIKVTDNTPELMQKLKKAASRYVRKGALHIEGEIKASMGEKKSGKRYGDHIASAPGESPAVDSSNLINSIFPEIKTLEAKVGTPVEYSQFLEDGTSRMAARPVWQSTLDEEMPTLERMLQDEISAIQ